MTGQASAGRRAHVLTGLLATGLAALCLTADAWSSSPSSAPATRDGSPPQALWGELKPVVSVKELMKYMVDPVADNIFNAVGSTVSTSGTVEWEPKTEEDWEKIRVGAVSLAEAADLLKVPR